MTARVVKDFGGGWKLVERTKERREAFNALMIVKARHGGYAVSGPAYEGMIEDVLFAGSLSDCLSFVEGEMTPDDAPAKPPGPIVPNSAPAASSGEIMNQAYCDDGA